jgi:general secretion pathway protein E
MQLQKDLLVNDSIMQDRVDKLLANTKDPNQVLKDITTSDFMTVDRLVKFIVDNIRAGVYNLSIIQNHDYIQEKDVLEKLALELNLLFIDLDSIDMDYRLASMVSLSQLQKYSLLPLYEDNSNITIAFNDPLNIEAQESIQRLFPKKPIKIAVATKKQIHSYLFKVELKNSVKGLIKNIREELNSITTPEEQRVSSSILKLIDVILKACINNRASDIHIEPSEKNCMVRARIDGKLAEIFIFDKDIYPPLASRLKLLSDLNIAQRRKPQDGRFSAFVEENEYDFRISSLPTLYGESIVMRVLDKQKALVPLEDAGMDSISYQKLLKALKAPYGIILVTGPTGSGKTTTLYGALNELRNSQDKVITIEDPIEYRMNLIQQVQVNTKIGLNFADALRSILRQDPDKIMIGEIRDNETLEIAIKAALSGHLVISTLHTNDAISSIVRMVDMGAQHYLLSGSIIAIQAQRLVRVICPHCKCEDKIPKDTLQNLQDVLDKDSNTVFYTGSGCKECNETGYKGREMICEVLNISNKMASLIAKGVSSELLYIQAKEEGFTTLLENGIAKAIEGVTSLKEVISVAK